MNNEETIIPQSHDYQTEQSQCVEATSKKTGEGKKIAATAAEAGIGGAVGAGGTYAAMQTFHDNEADEQKSRPQEDVQDTEEHTTEEPTVTAAEEPQKEQPAQHHAEEASAKVESAPDEGPDYTGLNHADPVAANPEVHTAGYETDDSEAPQVQVLGVYEAQGDQGQTMQAAILTDGEEVAAVIDYSGDGIADVLVYDENHNLQIDEGEVHDISNEQLQMSDFQEAYYAQQQEQMLQEHDTFAYNTNDDQPDYNNDVDPQFI